MENQLWFWRVCVETAGCLPKCVHPFSHSKQIAAGICLPTYRLLLGGRDIS